MVQALGAGEIASQHIGSADLENISYDLWGTTVHGESAANFLDGQHRLATAHWVHVYPIGSQGDLVVESELGYTMPGWKDKPQRDWCVVGLMTGGHRWSDLDEKLEAEKTADCIANAWSLIPYPFEPPEVVRPFYLNPDRQLRHWDLRPGEITRRRMAHYAVNTDISTHTVNGSIGKSLDVINVAAGVRTPEEIASRPAEPEQLFIGWTDLETRLKNSPDVYRHAAIELIRYLKICMSHQIRFGHRQDWANFGGPEEGVEVVTDGRIDLKVREGHVYATPAAIAVESIIDVATGTALRSNERARQVLLNFAVGIAEEG